MKISEHIYKTSGVEFSTNSNTFLFEDGDELVLFDSGYEAKQWNAMNETMKMWNLDRKKISKVFLTHGHYDHAGNTFRANEAGIEVYAADPDAAKIENGYPEMEKLFQRKWITAKVDHRLRDGQIFRFENGHLEAYSAPGHSEGSFAYVMETDGHRFLITGDMFYVRPLPPEDDIELELAYMGGEDFSMENYMDTLKKMAGLHCDVLLPGHYYVYYGDVDALCMKAYQIAKKMAEENNDR